MTASVDPAALRAARERAGLTQHQVAREVAVAGGEAVARWERGASEPNPTHLLRLAEIYRTPTRQLLHADRDQPDLRYLRLAAGLNSTSVARAVHVTVNTYHRWERGNWSVLPPNAVIDGLATTFGVTTRVVSQALMHTRQLGRDAQK